MASKERVYQPASIKPNLTTACSPTTTSMCTCTLMIATSRRCGHNVLLDLQWNILLPSWVCTMTFLFVCDSESGIATDGIYSTAVETSSFSAVPAPLPIFNLSGHSASMYFCSHDSLHCFRKAEKPVQDITVLQEPPYRQY
jgi:hypothetical protein